MVAKGDSRQGRITKFIEARHPMPELKAKKNVHAAAQEKAWPV
ncbi:hypothetical protein [Cupriavidus sp. CuC1]